MDGRTAPRPRWPRHAAPVIFLGLLLLAACGRGTPARADRDVDTSAEASSTSIAVPTGMRVQLEGRLPKAEWADAAARSLEEDAGEFRVKQFEGTLLLAFEGLGAWPAGARLRLYFAPDAPDSGAYKPGAVELEYEPLEHNRPHLTAFRQGPMGQVPVPEPVAARALLTPGETTVELAISLAALGITPSEASARRFALIWARPQGTRSLTWPPGLSIVPPQGGGPPPDLITTARWGRLEGWENAGGPGALPRSTWEHLRAEDEELARRGREAHTFGFEIAEEGKLPKRDAEQVPQLVGNLQWIADREPLSAQDLLLLAKGYRFLNRKQASLAVLDGLDAQRGWRNSGLYERALTLESMERYADAGAAWAALAAADGGSGRARYEAMVTRADKLLAGWEEEQAARASDRADPTLPIVLLRTSRGDVVVQLFRNDVREAVDQFLALVGRPEGDGRYYDDLVFHRVIGDFCAQVGDPDTRGGTCEVPGSSDGPVTSPVALNPRHGFYRGAVGYAHGMDRVNGSQFFIMVSPLPELEREGYTCFGHVIAGMEAVDRIELCDRLLEVRVLSAGSAARDEGSGNGKDGDD